MAHAPFVEANLVGFFDPALAVTGRALMRVGVPAPGMLDPAAIPPTRIHDARALQRASGMSEAAFFAANGFVLLPHRSAVADWDADPVAPDSPLTRTYLPEVEALVRERLLPGRAIDVWQGPPVRRGPGTANPEYAGGVHQDFGLSADEFQETLETFTAPEFGQAWRGRYDGADVRGFVAIDFWRTAGMREPLRHMPLAFCHPESVRVEDVVPLGLVDFTPSGRTTRQAGLRYDPAQRWYYYPEMTPDEVLAFVQFRVDKRDAEPRVACCFHSAFEHPHTPANAEVRQSSEQRALVFLLDD